MVKGTSSQRIVETREPVQNQKTQIDYEAQERARKERRRKMLDSIGRDAYNGVDLFEGTTPMTNQAAGKSNPAHASKALEGVDPRDPGVDLSAFGVGSSIWSKLAKG